MRRSFKHVCSGATSILGLTVSITVDFIQVCLVTFSIWRVNAFITSSKVANFLGSPVLSPSRSPVNLNAPSFSAISSAAGMFMNASAYE